MQSIVVVDYNHFLADANIYGAVGQFAYVVAAMVLALAFGSTIWIYRLQKITPLVLFLTGWLLLSSACGSGLMLWKINMSRASLTIKFKERKPYPIDHNIPTKESLPLEDTELDYSIQALLLVVGLVSGGLGANLVVTGISAKTDSK